MFQRACILVLVWALSGCAGFVNNEADCRDGSANWRARGYSDGYFGNTPQIVRLEYDCSSFGIKVAQTEYLDGWKDGHDEWDRLIGSMRKMSR